MTSRESWKKVWAYISAQWWLGVIILVTLFSSPTKLGMKSDPAFYGTIANNMVHTGQWWPMRFADYYFPTFSDSPPGSIWGMAAVFSVLPSTPWSAALFSRLCVLALYLVLLWGFFCSANEDQKRVWGRATLFLLLAHSWMGFIKYAGDGQLEGSLALAVGLLTAAIIQLKNREPAQSARGLYVLAFVSGLLGCLFKLVFFFGPLGAAFLWAILAKSKRAFGGACASFLGLLVGVGLLAFLDHHYGSSWIKDQFSVVSDAAVSGLNGSTPVNFSLLGWVQPFVMALKTQVEHSALWSVVLWFAAIAILLRRRLALASAPFFLLLVYVFFQLPIFISSFKLPHLFVASYPIGALFLASICPDRIISSVARINGLRCLKVFAVGLAVLLASVPHAQVSRQVRGEDWFSYVPLIRHNATEENPLRFAIPTNHEGLWAAYVYTGFHLGSEFPKRFASLEAHLEKNCTGGVLVGMKNFLGDSLPAIAARGWVPTPQPFPHRSDLSVFMCKNGKP